MDVVESDVATRQTGLVAAEASFNGLQPRVTALETDVNAAETNISTLLTTVGALNARVFTLESAKAPWVAGRMRDDGVVLSSVGKYTYTVSGRTGDANGMLISWTDPPHPANFDFVKLVTALSSTGNRERLFINTWIGSSRSFRVFISDFNGAGVNRHFTFAVF